MVDSFEYKIEKNEGKKSKSKSSSSTAGPSSAVVHSSAMGHSSLAGTSKSPEKRIQSNKHVKKDGAKKAKKPP